jgi:hypothetical protein
MILASRDFPSRPKSMSDPMSLIGDKRTCGDRCQPVAHDPNRKWFNLMLLAGQSNLRLKLLLDSLQQLEAQRTIVALQ